MSYVSQISKNEIIDKSARDKIKELQEQVQALRICILSIVRALPQANNGTLSDNHWKNRYSWDVAQSAYQIAIPHASHESGGYSLELDDLVDTYKNLQMYFNDGSNTNGSIQNKTKEYYKYFTRSTDDASSTITTVNQDSNIF